MFMRSATITLTPQVFGSTIYSFQGLKSSGRNGPSSTGRIQRPPPPAASKTRTAITLSSPTLTSLRGAAYLRGFSQALSPPAGAEPPPGSRFSSPRLGGGGGAGFWGGFSPPPPPAGRRGSRRHLGRR